MRILPTEYCGIKYRSRAEARWAVVFDNLGWRYSYEPEGFDLGTMCYLPDFYLPDHRLFFEVKGTIPTDEERKKAEMLSLATECEVVIAPGPPDPHRKEWNDDLFIFVPERCEDDEIVVFDYMGGFVSARGPEHPACSIHMGNLVHKGAYRDVGWRTAFLAAANMRFGVYDS